MKELYQFVMKKSVDSPWSISFICRIVFNCQGTLIFTVQVIPTAIFTICIRKADTPSGWDESHFKIRKVPDLPCICAITSPISSIRIEVCLFFSTRLTSHIIIAFYSHGEDAFYEKASIALSLQTLLNVLTFFPDIFFCHIFLDE